MGGASRPTFCSLLLDEDRRAISLFGSCLGRNGLATHRHVVNPGELERSPYTKTLSFRLPSRSHPAHMYRLKPQST